jgi:predicted metal-dependent peptidase
MFNVTVTEEQRIEKAVYTLMGEIYLLPLCAVMMVGKRTIEDNLPTACTDGKNEKYGRTFVAACSDAALRGCILHELGHKMWRHTTTWLHLWKLNPRKANMAADYVVNLWVQELIDNGVKASMDWPKPAMCLLDTKYKGMSVQQVFDLLPDDDADGAGMDEHDWENATQMNDDDLQELAEQIDSALRQGVMAAKKAGDGSELDLGQLLKPRVDWRQELREFISTTCAGSDYATWSRPNRRYIGAGMYMPSGVSQQVEELVVGVDTSGSIQSEALRDFLSEVVGICEQVSPKVLRLIYWDHKVQVEEIYSGDAVQKLVNSTKPKGGGGTDAACVPDYLRSKNAKPQAVVMLTDGYVSSWGQWDTPVLWCVIGSNRVPPVGRVVHVDQQ